MRTQWQSTAAASRLRRPRLLRRRSAPPRTPPPDAKRVDAAKAGTLTGRVLFDGPAPQNPPIKMSRRSGLHRANPNGATFETFAVDDGGLDNVFVYVKDGLGNYYFDTPTEPVKLDQQGCRYTPHVFGVRVGQPLEIVNSDPTLHNVHALPQAEPGVQLRPADPGDEEREDVHRRRR